MIQLTKELKITLLKWLKQGYIDKTELLNLQKGNEMTYAEIQDEIERLYKASGLTRECALARKWRCCYLQASEERKADMDAELAELQAKIDESRANKS